MKFEHISDVKERISKSYNKVIEKVKINSNKIVKYVGTHKKNVILVATALVLVFISFIIITINKVEDKKYNITDNIAEKYYYAGDYGNAISEYKKIYEKDNKNPLWLMKISEVYSVQDDVVNSQKYIDKVKAAKSKNVEVLNYITFTEFMNHTYGSALNDGEKALKIFPKNKKLIKTMFSVYMANGMLTKAKDLVQLYPQDTKSAFDTAEYSRILMLSGDFEKGLQKLKDAWYLDRDEYKIYDVLSQISMYNKDTILEKISNLSTKNPDEPCYKMWLAKIYSLTDGTADQAGKILDSIKNKNIGKIESKLIEASVYQNTNKIAKSDEIIEDLIKKYKDDYRILHTAGWYYLNKKQYDKAEKYCKESIIKNKSYTDNYSFLMPEILKAKGKSLEGEPFFRTAMYKEPYNYNIMLNVANYYWYTAKNTAKALEYFKLAEIIKPTDPEIKYNMALIDISSSKTDDAIVLLKECIKLSDAVPKYHRTLGTIYLNKGKSSEAISEIRYAYHGDENDVLTLNNAGCYYFSVEGNVEKGYYNLMKAYEGLNDTHDKYTKDTIKSNFTKAKAILDKYKNGSPNENITIPNFVLFY